MGQIVDLLLYKLSDKGLTPVEIPRLVKDVLSILSEGGEFTTNAVNHRLETLGWDKAILEQFTLELILALLENERKYETKITIIH